MCLSYFVLSIILWYEKEKRKTKTKKKERKKLNGGGRIRTRNLEITKLAPYHWATETNYNRVCYKICIYIQNGVSDHTTFDRDTLSRKRQWRFRDRDLKQQIPCHTASKNLDAQLLRNDTSFLSNLLCKSPLINYSPTIFVRLFQPIHWYETRILTFSSEKRAPISTMFTCRTSHNVL